jgi:hypothetical protein
MDRNGAQEKDVAHLSLYLFLGECLRFSREVLLFSTSNLAEMVLPKLETGLCLGWIPILGF